MNHDRAAEAVARVADYAYREWLRANPDATTLQRIAKVYEISTVVVRGAR